MEKTKNYVVPVLAVLFVIALGSSIVLYKQLHELKLNPNKIAQDATQALVKEVGALIVLPEETPTIATVSDPERLKDQVFFAKAKVGDRVLIYTNARKAILYSPTEHKIVEVAPITIGQQSPTAPTAPTPAPAAASATTTKAKK